MKDEIYRLNSLEGNGDAAFILEAAEDAKNILKEQNHIGIDLAQAIPTIVEVYLKAILDKVAKKAEAEGGTAMVNMFDLFEIGFDSVDDESDEKGGNIVPAFMPLGAMKTLGKSDESQSGEK